MSGSGKKRRLQEEIVQLEIKKRNGMMRAAAAFVGMAVLIAIKVGFSLQGAQWANTEIANLVIFLLAIVAAGIAGIGTRDWSRARNELRAKQAKLKK